MKTQQIILKYFNDLDKEIYSEILEIKQFFRRLDKKIDLEVKQLDEKIEAEMRFIKFKIIDETGKVTIKDNCKVSDYNTEIKKIKKKYG